MAPGKMKDYTGGLIQTLRQVYNGGFYHRLVVQFYVCLTFKKVDLSFMCVKHNSDIYLCAFPRASCASRHQYIGWFLLLCPGSTIRG
jgi:hypothetical protein